MNNYVLTAKIICCWIMFLSSDEFGDLSMMCNHSMFRTMECVNCYDSCEQVNICELQTFQLQV